MGALNAVVGRQTKPLTRSELDALVSSRERVVVDVGTGDGRFAYRRASEDASAFVVALDPVKENMEKTAFRASRKPARGGLDNVVFLCATLEVAAPELAGMATEVHVVLPWGELLRGLVECRPSTLNAVRALASPGASIEVVLNAELWNQSVPVSFDDLPELDAGFATEVLVPAYSAHGIDVTGAGMMSPDDVKALDSSWSRRLAHGRHPAFLYLRGRAV